MSAPSRPPQRPPAEITGDLHRERQRLAVALEGLRDDVADVAGAVRARAEDAGAVARRATPIAASVVAAASAVAVAGIARGLRRRSSRRG
jgi:hypothetical protein